MLSDRASEVQQEQKQLLADTLEAVDFPAGTFIFRRGDVGDRFYIVREGAVLLTKPGDTEPAAQPLTEGACFGERAVLKHNTRRVPQAPTVCALACFHAGREQHACICWNFSRHVMEESDAT